MLSTAIYSWKGIRTCLYEKNRKWKKLKNQEPMTGSLPMQYTLESTFARIFLFLALILQQETHIYNNLHQLAQFAYIVFAIFVFAPQ